MANRMSLSSMKIFAMLPIGRHVQENKLLLFDIVLFLELLDPSGAVHDLLLLRVEGMAI